MSSGRMSRAPEAARALLRRLLWADAFRWLWPAMLVIHAPALLKAWKALFAGQSAAGVLEGCLWLSLSALFFVLQACCGGRLRFRRSARALVVLCLALVLLHAGPLGLRVGDTPRAEMPAAAVLLLAGLECVQDAVLSALRTGWRGLLVPCDRTRRCVSAVAVQPRDPFPRSHAPRAPPI